MMICYLCKKYPAILKAYQDQERRDRVNDSEILWNDPRIDDIQAAQSFIPSRPELAFPKILELAEAGSTWSMLQVGRLYHRDFGVTQDLALAEHWYVRAASAGSDNAMLYAAGFALSRRDVNEVEAILRDAVHNERTLAMRLQAVADIYVTGTKDSKQRGRALLQRAYELGNVSAGYELARAMAKGKYGFRAIPYGLNSMQRFVVEIFSVDDALSKNQAANAGAEMTAAA